MLAVMNAANVEGRASGQGRSAPTVINVDRIEERVEKSLVHKARKESRVCPAPLAPKAHRENKARRV